MARIHTPRRGQSHSTRPVTKRSPSWCGYRPEEAEALILKLAKEGNTPDRIGIILRDQHGIPLVKSLIGKTIVEVMKEAKVQPETPEDLAALLRRASRMIRHLEKNKTDHRNIHNLQMLEARIHRLSKYYKEKGLLHKDWKYKPVVGSFL